jgi:hypothetical protein
LGQDISISFNLAAIYDYSKTETNLESNKYQASPSYPGKSSMAKLTITDFDFYVITEDGDAWLPFKKFFVRFEPRMRKLKHVKLIYGFRLKISDTF